MSGNWVDIGASGVVREGAPLEAQAGGAAVLVVRCGPQLYAVEDRCTHDGETLGTALIEECEVTCPRHGARFCLKSGEVLSPPAYEPLRTFAVREADGRVLLEVPE
ncbi:MAG: non-heme iron oxygenase ferredoxin subunit [Gammaproteobacteria bacterium]|nr:non-heme iron oxygenase ferredoxin subunit [Gammaproteobacteria bacterium]MBV9697974.1 non-heme iron oxygenase ferredoxin subunit [Gammaproteobacteria bacterium]